MYEWGQYFPENFDKANSYYEIACEWELAYGCHNLAWFRWKGRGGKEDKAYALELFERSCEQGAPDSCLYAANRHYYGVVPDPETLIKPSDQRDECALGSFSACLRNLWAPIATNEIQVNTERALHFYEKACDGNEVDACYNLGILYSDGTEVAKDDVKALDRYSRACELDNRSACNRAGWHFENAVGTEEDRDAALQFFTKSCELDSGYGCNRVGLYADKRKDGSNVLLGYEKSCELKHATGCYNLAWEYDEGAFITQDKVRANELFKQACGMEYGLACNVFGVRHAKGDGIEKNIAKAVTYYSLACKHGNGTGCGNLAY